MTEPAPVPAAETPPLPLEDAGAPPLPSGAGPSAAAPPPLPPAGAADAAQAAPPPPGDGVPPPLPAEGGAPSPLPAEGGAPPPLPPPPDEEEEEEEDPLVAAQRAAAEAERRATELAEATGIKAYDDEEMRAFYSDLREVDRENEVNRILGAFKLNPFEQLNLRFDTSPEEVRRQYRKVSLMVHPDKCRHPRAKDAFEVVGNAQKELLDEEKRGRILYLLNHAKDQVLAEWRKAAKHDAAVRLAAAINEEGRAGVEAAYLQSTEFHEAWKLKSRDVMARSEWRRRKMTKRIAEEEERAKEEHRVEREDVKRKRDHDKAWEKTREGRVGTWRDFMTKKSKKSKGGSLALGGLKPPKQVTRDEDRDYIRIPVGEMFRPAPMKRPPTSKQG
eukprot:scaffold6.g2561.t1